MDVHIVSICMMCAYVYLYVYVYVCKYVLHIC